MLKGIWNVIRWMAGLIPAQSYGQTRQERIRHNGKTLRGYARKAYQRGTYKPTR